MKNLILFLLLMVGVTIADTYTLTIDKQGGQGTATLPTSTSIKYQHDGSVVPTDIPGGFALDSIQVHATDAANNVGPTAWLFIKITPVNDHAPIVKSDTITVIEGGSHTWSPVVTDGDN